MAEDHHQPRVVARGGEFHAADLRGSHDIAGDPDDEEVAQALIEHDLRRHPRIGAPQDDCEGLLLGHERGAARLAQEDVGPAHLRGEPEISLPQPGECFER